MAMGSSGDLSPQPPDNALGTPADAMRIYLPTRRYARQSIGLSVAYAPSGVDNQHYRDQQP